MTIKNITGYEISFEDMFKLVGLVPQLQIELNSQDFLNVMAKFRNLTMFFTGGENSSFANFTCGSSFGGILYKTTDFNSIQLEKDLFSLRNKWTVSRH